MNKEKQIEEMAKDLCECYVDYDTGTIDIKATSVKLFAKGYRKQSGWISVDDGLPNETRDCLVVLNNEDIDIRLFNSKNDPYQTWPFMLNKFLFVDNKGEWHSTDRVTHWMPLPEAPKMKGGAE